MATLQFNSNPRISVRWSTPVAELRKKTFSLRIYLTAITRWFGIKKSSSSSSSSTKPRNPPQEINDNEIEEVETMKGAQSIRYNGDKHKSMENCFPYASSPLSRNGSRRGGSPSPSFLYRSRSSNSSKYGLSPTPSLLRNGSRNRLSTTPIMFSNSSGLLKPPPVQKDLECTLEELCYGCKKKIKITRDVVTKTGQIIEEEEILTINVKAGWKKGTKITFEGMGNERAGSPPADITFVIAEQRHPLFQRIGDDLEIAIEIPLVKALTGCDISIPLLGGKDLSLMIDDIIHPGYEKTIEGHGMPNTKHHGKRGNLKVIFLVEFPTHLTPDQRFHVFSILQDSC